MAIERVEIEKVLVFKEKLTIDFCPGVNVFIGSNASGKTTLLKAMYDNTRIIAKHRNIPDSIEKADFAVAEDKNPYGNVKTKMDSGYNGQAVYIPEKDILEHNKGLLTFIEKKQTAFSHIYKDVLISAHDIPTKHQSELQLTIGQKIYNIIDGEVNLDRGEGVFYTIKSDGSRVPFALEASGFKKFGFLGLLLSCGQLDPGTIVFWDEPENSLNPELVPQLVDILLELSRNGVQIFIATHSEILAGYFAVNREKEDDVMFYSFYKENGKIEVNSSNRFDFLEPNNLAEEPVKLYIKEIDRGLGK